MASRITAKASWPVTVAVVDRGLRYEFLDLDGVRTLDGDLGKLLVFDLDVLVFGYGIPLHDILALDHLALPESIFWSLMRLPVFRLSRLKLTFSL
jgi:hypothetical protein